MLEGFSQCQIRDRLNADGIPTQSGKKWTQAHISALARKTAYLGLVSNFQGNEHEADFPAIIDRELWDRVHARLAINKNRKLEGRQSKGRHLMSGRFFRCGACGSAIIAQTKKGRETYVCRGRHEKLTGCDAFVSINRVAVDSAVFSYFARAALDMKSEIDAIEARRETELRLVRSQLTLAERELLTAQDRLTRVRRAFQDGKLDPDDWTEHRAELMAELEAGKQAVKAHKRREAAIHEEASRTTSRGKRSKP